MNDLELTRLLHAWRAGDEAAFERLLEALYLPLRGLAHARLAGERAGHTLDTGALVNEAYMRLVDIERVEWEDRAHFLAVASRVMRRVLIDYALMRKAKKRGGGRRRVELDEAKLGGASAASGPDFELLIELDDVLDRLEAAHPRQARAIELYYLGGLTQREIAVALDSSQPTVQRDLRFGRAWLARIWGADVDGWRRGAPGAADRSAGAPGAAGGDARGASPIEGDR